MLEFLRNNLEIVAIFISALPIVISIVQLILKKKREQEITNYEKFHKLVAGIANQENDHKLGLDQQIAIVFEMRNFPEYRPVIIRILKDSIINWQNDKKNDLTRIIIEANKTIKYVNMPVIIRFLFHLWGKIWSVTDVPEKK